MTLRVKLTVGLGFLFAIIFALSFYSSYDIQRLSKDADRILRDNYDSLVYCKNMLIALDDMRTAAGNAILISNANRPSGQQSRLFKNSQSTFETNLKAEENNITEAHEREYAGELARDYDLFSTLCQQMNKTGITAALYFNEIMPAYLIARQAIVGVNDLNMQAIERKNLVARHNADTMIVSFAVVGALLIILAFFYFWYFPFYVSNTLSYLSGKMKELMKDAGIQIDTRTNDEAFILLQSIELLRSKLSSRGTRGASKHDRRTKQ